MLCDALGGGVRVGWEGGLRGRGVCICMADSLQFTAEMNTTLESSYIPPKCFLIKEAFPAWSLQSFSDAMCISLCSCMVKMKGKGHAKQSATLPIMLNIARGGTIYRVLSVYSWKVRFFFACLREVFLRAHLFNGILSPSQ